MEINLVPSIPNVILFALMLMLVSNALHFLGTKVNDRFGVGALMRGV